MNDDLDARLRDRLQSSTGGDGGAGAGIILEQLRPAMVRARRAHRVRVGTAMCSVLVFFAGGAMALRAISNPQPEFVVSAGPGPEGSAGGDIPTTADDDRGSTGAPGVTEPGAEITAAPSGSSADDAVNTANGPAETTGTLITGPVPSVTESPTTEAEPSTTTSTPQQGATTPTTKAPSTTAAPQSGTSKVRSVCGTITVSYDLGAETVTLLSHAPKVGYEVEVKNSGPEAVEVALASAGDKCEIHVEIEDKKLDLHVSEPDPDDTDVSGDGDED